MSQRRSPRVVRNPKCPYEGEAPERRLAGCDRNLATRLGTGRLRPPDCATAPHRRGEGGDGHRHDGPRAGEDRGPHPAQDTWWQAPLLTFLGLSAFVVYGIVRIFHDSSYWVEDFHYLAPFYSPCLSQSCVPGSSHFLGQPFPQLPSWMSPAMFVLILPGGFRATCYYYRKAYYRAFWLSPPACAVPNRTRPTPARPASR